MPDITVRVLSEDEWQQYKEFRLRALQESPDAFAADHAVEKDYDEDTWRARMRRSQRLLATVDGEPQGIVSLRADDEIFENAAEVFGLWVSPELRGTGVAAQLVQRSAEAASDAGWTRLIYWVGTDNGRAVAFASSYGFRPTEYRRPMKDVDGNAVEDEEELAMVLGLRS